MTLKHVFLGAAGALAVCALSASVPAAPLTSAMRSAAPNSIVEKVAYRRCGWRKGKRVCRWVRRPSGYVGFFGYYGGYDPSAAIRAAVSGVPLP